ncbi:MAG: ORF6N domain-containing protein, partial [Endomicrobiia bacterium]|nr:ORF6N domain-containing protein [Endomicrobiia bacterium]
MAFRDTSYRTRKIRELVQKIYRQDGRGLMSQSVISSQGGLRRAAPYAFTEQGVAMLSSVLKSERAVRIN